MPANTNQPDQYKWRRQQLNHMELSPNVIARIRQQTFLRIAAGLEDPSAADAVR